MQSKSQKQSIRRLKAGGLFAAALSAVFLSMWFLNIRQEAVRASRMAQCNSNHATIVASMNQFRWEKGRLPADIVSPDATPLLSWRVELLSVLDPDRFAAFDVTQPWDSPKNLSAIHPTPQWFHCPGESTQADSVFSSYYVVRFGGAQSESSHGIQAAKSGATEAKSCVAIVEAEGLKIPWSCPGDLDGDSCQYKLRNPEKATSACGRPAIPFGTTLNGERVVFNRN